MVGPWPDEPTGPWSDELLPRNPYQRADMERDAEKLRKAMKGWGCDEATLIDVLGLRSNAELQQLRVVYQQSQGRDLRNDLKGETGGTFGKLVRYAARQKRKPQPSRPYRTDLLLTRGGPHVGAGARSCPPPSTTRSSCTRRSRG